MTLSDYRHLSFAERMTLLLFSNIVVVGRLRIDLPSGNSCELGDGSGPLIAMQPPKLTKLLSMMLNPGLRAGEYYMDGIWKLTEGKPADFIHLIEMQTESIYGKIYQFSRRFRTVRFILKQFFFVRFATRKTSRHYDISQEFYGSFLGSTMAYSCAFFDKDNETLDKAQVNKFAVTAERLALETPDAAPGLSVLNIGCGWGGLDIFLAEKYGCDVVGISIADNQIAYCNRRESPRRGSTIFLTDDYIDFCKKHHERFDRVVSVGMFEHVGIGHYEKFFSAVRRALKPGGIALIHSIVRREPGRVNEWMDRYIFPGGYAPALSEMLAGAEASQLYIDAVYIHDGSNYARTVRAWNDNFEQALQRGEYRELDPTFLRMWEFYMGVAEAMFDRRGLGYQVCQLRLERLPGDV